MSETMPMKLLIVEDNKDHAEIMAESFKLAPLFPVIVETARNLVEAYEFLGKTWPDIIILDAKLPRTPDGWPAFVADQFLDKIQEVLNQTRLQSPAVLLVSGEEEAADRFEEVVKRLQDGLIYDVIPKSLANPGWNVFQAVLRHKVEQIQQERVLRLSYLQPSGVFEALKLHGMITRDFNMIAVWKDICKAAEAGVNTLIIGENGTGKELVARAIATLRGRTCKSFIIATITKELFESLVFGIKKGAVPQVDESPGWIGAAGDDVLFMDEIFSVPMDCQPKLLRAVDPKIREYNRLGETQVRKATCMFVFAGQFSPEKAFDMGLVREDFANKISSYSIELPALRERRGDIPLLITYFLEQSNIQHKKNVSLEKAVIDRFRDGPWPGNIRRLEQFIDRIVIRSESTHIGWDDVVGLISQDALQRQLGIVSGIMKVSPVDIPNDPLILQIRLKTELAEPEPLTWQFLDESHESIIVGLIESGLNEGKGITGQGLLKNLQKSLNERERNNPARIHFYQVLLYMVLHPENKVDLGDIRRICKLGHDFSARIAEELDQTGFVDETKEAKRRVFHLKTALLQQRQGSPPLAPDSE